MKMVASAKLHKAQGAIENMLPYQKKLNKILTNFLSADLPIESPYVQEREVKRVAIVVFSSNTSLCGAFNANVIKMMMQTIGEFRTLGQDNILIFPVGKKVDEAAKRMGFKPQEVSPTLSDKPTYQEAAELAHRLMDEILKMCPACCLRMTGKTARVTRISPNRLVSNTSRICCSSDSSK